MNAVIAYQSLNSNSSTEHNLAASTGQVFLCKAQATLAPMYPSGSGALKYPTSDLLPDPHIALHGPAELVPVASADAMDGKRESKSRKRKREDDGEGSAVKHFKSAQKEMLHMVTGKALQIYQMAHRAVHKECDLIALGELDATHTDWGAISSGTGSLIRASIQSKACNCFSLHGPSSRSEYISEGMGWCAARCNSVLVVFVHVPNDIAGSVSKATEFYKKIHGTLLNTPGGGIVDVIMGDTNQPRESFSVEVVGDNFRDGHANGASIEPIDMYSKTAVAHKGTNSVNNKKFDVAVYNVDTVKKIQVEYFTQFSFSEKKAAAYTDHMGMIVSVEKK